MRLNESVIDKPFTVKCKKQHFHSAAGLKLGCGQSSMKLIESNQAFEAPVLWY